MPENNDKADTELLEAAVREGGRIAKSFAAGSYKSWSKADASPVSEADLAVDRYLNGVLLAARPNYGWLSEETTDNAVRLSTKRVFVVDPIDGTSAFLKGLPHFTICAAVVDSGKTVAGAVYNPMMEECYTAQRGAGAWLNGVPIHVSTRERLEGCRILANKSVLANPKFNWPTMERDNRDSAAYRLVLVASGAFDATISLTTKRDWDLAAADLIVREAGGIVSWQDGTIPFYNQASALHPGAIAAGPALHAQMLSHLRHLESS